jgi:hypothetical protein
MRWAFATETSSLRTYLWKVPSLEPWTYGDQRHVLLGVHVPDLFGSLIEVIRTP